MPSINGVSGVREALIGFIQRSRTNLGGGLAGLLADARSSALLEQVINATSSGVRRGSYSSELAIADTLDLNARLSRAGSTNAQIGISRSATADSALSSATDIVGRLGELSARASDPTLSDADRQVLNSEAQGLQEELSYLRDNASFNGQPVLQGTATTTLTSPDTSVSTVDADLDNVTTPLAGLDLTTTSGANAGLSASRDALDALSLERVQVGSNQNRLERARDFALTEASNLEEAAAGIRENELGIIGAAFGPQLAPIVNELAGMNF